MNPFIALHLLDVFSSGVRCSLGRGMMELLLHVLRAAAPVGRSVHVLGLGQRAAETHFCPGGGPATQPDQEARLRWPNQEQQSVTVQLLLRRMGSSHLVTVVLK